MIDGIKAFDLALHLFNEGLCAEDVLEFMDSVFSEFQNIERDYMESLSAREIGEVVI